MKKTLSCKSLSSLKSASSLKKQKSNLDQKLLSKNSSKILSSILRSPQNDKNDIKQMYEYKIKQRSTKNQTNKTKNDFKKQMLNKLMNRQRIKTQQDNNIQQIQNLKKSNSKNSKNSKNNVTMNLNVSFVKIKNMGGSKYNNSQQHKESKDFVKNKEKSHQRKFESQQTRYHNVSQNMQGDFQNNDLKNMLNYYALKNSITLKDLQNFHELNMKIFVQFEKIIKHSSKTYQKIIKNIGMNYQSKQPHQDNLPKEMKYKISQIQNLYQKMGQLKFRESTFKTQNSQNQHDQLKQSESLVSSASEVSSYKINPQKYESYRLKKLNQNLDLLINFEQNKNKKSTPKENGPTMYLSKPVSSQVSRKVSFNNSFNNSLKETKFQ